MRYFLSPTIGNRANPDSVFFFSASARPFAHKREKNKLFPLLSAAARTADVGAANALLQNRRKKVK